MSGQKFDGAALIFVFPPSCARCNFSEMFQGHSKFEDKNITWYKINICEKFAFHV